jgi:hypothetical protein
MPAAQTPAQQQSFHPEVIRTAAAALLPSQSLFENAWKITVQRVQTEFTQIHTSLTNKIDAEKAAHACTLDTCTRLRHELEDSRYERGLVNGERERLSTELVKAAKENRILRASLESAKGALKESKERCDLLAAENEIWKKGWAVAKIVTPRLQDMYAGKTDDPSRQNNGELLQQIREQVDRELQIRIGKSTHPSSSPRRSSTRTAGNSGRGWHQRSQGLVWQHILFKSIDRLSGAVKPSHAVTDSSLDPHLAKPLSFKRKTKSRLTQRNFHGCRYSRLRQSRVQTRNSQVRSGSIGVKFTRDPGRETPITFHSFVTPLFIRCFAWAAKYDGKSRPRTSTSPQSC